jgi:diguanylate cyclase (GGDEF)-like protein
METTDRRFEQTDRTNVFEPSHALLPVVGFLGPIGTFLLAVSGLDEIYKLTGLGLIAAFSLLVCIYSYANLRKRDDEHREGSVDLRSPQDKLLALDDAQRFFGASLKLPEMFKLASNRVAEIIPFDASVLFLPGEDPRELRAMFAEGENAVKMFEAVREDTRLAELAFHSGEIEVGEEIEITSPLAEHPALDDFAFAAAIPLLSEGRVFAVFQIYSRSPLRDDDRTAELLGTVGEKLARLLIGSIAFERSLSNALTDQLTGLPNERALLIILESQLAECQRSRNDRPLTVLSIDIRDFASINAEYGHAVGDRVLSFAADRIKAHLRKMDFLARAENDEFLVVLPTATSNVALEVLERIMIGFGELHFQFAKANDVRIELNVGWASFWQDGETAQQLLRAAQRRKQDAKCEEQAALPAFSKEYVN